MQKNTSRQPWTKPVDTHYKNTYFFHWPWQKCLPSQIKRPFPPSPFAMLFPITKEMHTWAVRPKQRCNRGGEGGEFVPFGHEDCMAWNWKLHWNVSTVLSGVVAFPFFVDMLDSIQHSVKKTCHVVQDVGHLMSFQNVLFTQDSYLQVLSEGLCMGLSFLLPSLNNHNKLCCKLRLPQP